MSKANGKTRGRAQFDGPTNGRRNAVMWAVAHAPPSSQPGGLTTTERAALLTIEAFVGYKDRNTGWCSPTIATLADALDLKERQTQVTLRALKGKGWLAIEAHSVEGYQTTNRYRVTPPETPVAASEDDPAEPDAPVH